MQPEDELKNRSLLDNVVRQGTTLVQLFTSEDQTLLVRVDGDILFVLDSSLHIFNAILTLNQ